MLVLHSSSRCDVCLSEYTWETSGKRPHAIACGHIFCRDCLYTNSPPLCPLCRKPYLPNKMKKLHVDRPENIDDHRETDLLQRLAISWEAPPEQLEELTIEVDIWLRNRSDDACIALRKARAALTKNRELKETQESYEETILALEERGAELNNFFRRERHQAAVSSEAAKATIDHLSKEIIGLKLEIESLQAPTHRYIHPGYKNPLPRPPEPISTDQIPTFQQAVSESGSVRYSELPISPPSRYPFEIESRSSRKGNTSNSNLHDRVYYDDPRYQQLQQLVSPPPATYSPPPTTSHYVHPHVSQPSQYEPSSPRHATRSTGLQLHFDSTAQPLDAFALTHAYLREYSSGFINGQELAAGRRISEFPNNNSGYAGQASSVRPSAQAYDEPSPNLSYRSIPTNTYQNQTYSAPATSERFSRPPHRRHPTASSILPSASPIQNDRPSSRSRSGSRRRVSSPAIQQYMSPSLASILSNNPRISPSRRRSFSPVSPQITPANVFSPSIQPHQQQHNRTPSITSNIVLSGGRNSPSARSHMTLLSSDTWGTATPSHLTTGSLIAGLTAFRFGGETALVGGDAASLLDLGSDGASIRTREMSFSDMISESPERESPPSPVRPVHSMVGVLPTEGETSSYRSSRDGYRSPHSVDDRSHNGWGINGSHASTRDRARFVSGYQTDDDRSQHSSNHSHRHSQAREERSNTYRSPASADRQSYGYRTYSHPRPHVSRHSSDDPYQQHADDNHSVVSIERHPRISRRPPHQTRGSHLSLPEESPFQPATADYADSRDRPSSHHSAGTPGMVESFGNALGLDLTTGPTTISAPTPVISSRTFLRSFSRDHYES